MITPDTNTSPWTVSLDVGFVVPMPMFPKLSTVNLMASLFLKDQLDVILNALNDLPDDLVEALQKLADEQKD